jgi:apolipoprotein N-acyltransferase
VWQENQANKSMQLTQNRYFLACLSAFLLWLAWPPIPYTSFLLFVAFVPLLFAVEAIQTSELPKKGRKIFGLAFLSFVLWNTASIYWVFNSLHAAMPLPAALAISLIPFGLGALLMAFAFWGYYAVSQVLNKTWSYAALLCFWISYEYLHQSWDLAFPWMNLGNGFAQTHQLVQWYEYTGVYGGTIWVLLANILIFEALGQKSRKLGLIGLAWIIVPAVFSLIRYETYTENINPANVVVVQPNVDPYQKYGSLSPEQQVARLIDLSKQQAQPNTEYFIWPETAMVGFTDEEQIRANGLYLQVLNFLQPYANANVLSGIESYKNFGKDSVASAQYDPGSGNFLVPYNAAIHIENAANVQFYHKSKLVPGVEQLPFPRLFSFFKSAFSAFGGSTGGYGKQAKPSVFYAQSGMGVSPIICYESIWGAYVAESVQNGAGFIAIITNDAWWGNTSGKDQHLAYAKLRAIENRRWVARSANTGISGFINQRGDVVKKSGWWVPAALKADINLNEEQTFYTQYGDILAILGCSGALALVLLAFFMKYKLKASFKTS